MTNKPGRKAIETAIKAEKTQEEICYDLASEIRAEWNAIKNGHNGMQRRVLAEREAKLKGWKMALMLALGLPLGSWDEVEEFLETFGAERLAHARQVNK